MLVSSWAMEVLLFTLSSMNLSKVFSTRSKSWEVDEGWRGRSTIWFKNFLTSTLIHRGTPIVLEKGEEKEQKEY